MIRKESGDHTRKMHNKIYHTLFYKNRKVFILLIDPENCTTVKAEEIISAANKSSVDMILVGGSLTSLPIDQIITTIKKTAACPVVLFPGNLLQLSVKADGILLLSLLSGRNPEYLIGNHVLASQFLKKSGIEIIPTGYILIDGHQLSSVEYMSNTRPIPSEKSDIVVATALAGEQLGLKLIYLEAGSGASDRIREEIIAKVMANISIPLIVGGGIKTPEDIRRLYKAGANGVVVGSAVENDYHVLNSLAEVRNEFIHG
jgi:phosphoglycerol geranylgeranyltransferase